jgi:hypothetical protein
VALIRKGSVYLKAIKQRRATIPDAKTYLLAQNIAMARARFLEGFPEHIISK